MNRGTLFARRGVLAATIASVAVAAFLLLWITYMVYDDEGYVLYSLREFALHGHLYDRVYSQYGPFFYLFYRALHALGLVFTNTTARCLTLACWIGAAAACGAIVWRATRGGLTAACAVVVAVFIHLLRMTAEPSHPGGLIALLVSVAAWVGARDDSSPAVRAIVVGTIGAMLTLTKINIGVFLFIGSGAWWLLSLPEEAKHPWTRRLMLLGLLAVPWALMTTLLGDAWVRIYATVVAAGGVAIVLTVEPRHLAGAQVSDGAIAAVAAIVVGALTIALTLLSGTTPGGILEGVLLGPLRHPSNYAVPFDWRPGTLTAAVGGVALAATIRIVPARIRESVIGTARVALAIGFGVSVAATLGIGTPGYVLSYGVASAWVFAIRTGEKDSTYSTRTWLALLFVTQSLHGYPIAGSQVCWGTFLWIPLAALGLGELGQYARAASTKRIVGAGIWALSGVVVASIGWGAWGQFRGSDPLRLPGAEDIRLPEAISSELRLVSRNAAAHSDILFTLPGMMSFNLWTGVEPPTGANATHWFNLLSPAEQGEILQRLENSPRAGLVVQRFVYDLLDQGHYVTKTPLLRWILANFAPAIRIGSYEFWVRKGRTIAPIDCARLYLAEPGAPTRYRIDIIRMGTFGTRITSIELRRLAGNGSMPIGSWTARNARFVIRPISEDGAARGPAVAAAPPLDPGAGLVRISVFTDNFPPGFPVNGGILYLVGPTGRRVGEARFIQ